MGDDLLSAQLSFDMPVDIDGIEERVLRPIKMITKEHQYARTNPTPQLKRLSHGWEILIHYRLPDSDGDPDRFHRCGLEVMFERIRQLLHHILGPESWDTWEMYTELQLP